MQKRPQVVVIGAGFGGMQTAQSLSKSDTDVLLIDQNNHHTFIPLLYQVAAAQIEPEFVAYPVRTMLNRGTSNIRFLMARVTHIDAERQIIEVENSALSSLTPTHSQPPHLSSRHLGTGHSSVGHSEIGYLKSGYSRITYDYLVLATGSHVKYLGVPGARDYAFPMKTLTDAIAIRNHLLCQLEKAAHSNAALEQQRLLTIAIVGGGATGVEIAGTLIEMKHSLQKDYPDLDLKAMRIVLVQSGGRLLPDLPHRLGRYAAWKLRQMGVSVSLQTKVTRILPDKLEFQDGSSLAVGTVVWAVGLEAERPPMNAELEQTDKNKVRVRSTLQLRNYYNIYAIGDLAYVEIKGKPLVGVAPEALQQGVAIARNIKRQIQGKAPRPFRYLNKGRLAIIGCYSGVGKIGPFFLTGFLPWLMWLIVHLIYLPGFRNRWMVLMSWLYGYGTGRRPVRLILNDAYATTLFVHNRM